MKNEPDNRTEQWLQAYAHKRREQAGQEVELHEATRRMLLDESGREWSETAASEPESAPAKSSWFSWAWIGSVAAGVMLVAVISKNDPQGNPADPPVEMTKNISGTGDGNIVDQKRASTPPADEAILGGKKDQVGDLDTASAARKITPSSTEVVPSVPRPAQASSAARPAQQPGDSDVGGGAPGPAPAAFSGARLAKTFQAVSKVQDSANFYSGPERLRQNFAPNIRRTVTRSAAPAIAVKTLEPVMQNFQFERVGINVLVMDHDGSEYRGTVRALEKADLAGRDLPADKENEEKGKAARGKSRVRPGSSAATRFSFQVSGTNRTLNRLVVFEGNILNEQAMKLKSSAGLLAVKGPGEAKKPLAGSKKTEALPRLRIQGRAQAGKLQYDVDARNVPSPRPAKAASPAPGRRPLVSAAFAKKHPQGSYSPGELLVGMDKGLELATIKKSLVAAVPGLEIRKAMFNNTILHVRLPDSTNVEQTMMKLKSVKSVRYSEMNGIVGIQPVPRQPRPLAPKRSQPKPLIQPR